MQPDPVQAQLDALAARVARIEEHLGGRDALDAEAEVQAAFRRGLRGPAADEQRRPE